MELKSLLDQPNKLPTIPKVAQQLIASFGAEDVSVDAIASQLAADPALSAKLLRLANSAYFHLSRTIGTVDDALRMLGFVMVRNLVLGNSMVSSFRNTRGMDLPQFWRYNLYTACAARWLASREGANGDLVFTVGLMHGIGQLHLHAAAPDAMVALDRQCHVLEERRAELEQQVLGFHHGDVAAALATLWNFPAPISAALQAAVQPLAQPEFSQAGAWVYLGAWRARVEVMALDAENALASYPTDVARHLHLTPGWAAAQTGIANTPPGDAMPALPELTEGLEAMLN